jgi:hypothetical protein
LIFRPIALDGRAAVAACGDILEHASTKAVSAQTVAQLGGIDEAEIHPDSDAVVRCDA